MQILPDRTRSPERLAVSLLLARFVMWNLGFLALFWLLRVPFMEEEHFMDLRPTDGRTTGRNGLHRWFDSLYTSVMTQTTVGAADVVPVSTTAQVLTGLQALSTFLALAAVLLAAQARELSHFASWRGSVTNTQR